MDGETKMTRKWWTLTAVSVATFMLLLDITVVNTALPAIEEDLGASFTELQWVIDAYTLSLAALVLTAGVLADRLGRRRVFGPVVGGALVDGIGWESIFFLNVPVGIAAVALTYAKLAESRDPNASRIDW